MNVMLQKKSTVQRFGGVSVVWEEHEHHVRRRWKEKQPRVEALVFRLFPPCSCSRAGCLSTGLETVSTKQGQ